MLSTTHTKAQAQAQAQAQQPSKVIITAFPHREQFLAFLQNNPGIIVIKFGATWCGPCRLIQPAVDSFFLSSPDTVLCCQIDIDESMDLYAFLKSKKMIHGIPALFCYKNNNHTWIPDDSVIGSNPSDVHSFFQRCVQHLQSVAPLVRRK